MKFRQWIIKKLQGKNPKYANSQGVITEEMRVKALETRRLAHDVSQAEKRFEYQKRIQALENINNPKMTTEDKLVSMLLPMLANKLAGEQAPSQNYQNFGEQQLPQTPTSNEGVVYSKEQIKSLLTLNPKITEHSKQFKDEQIKEFLMQQIPNIAPNTIKDVIVEVRSRE